MLGYPLPVGGDMLVPGFPTVAWQDVVLVLEGLTVAAILWVDVKIYAIERQMLETDKANLELARGYFRVRKTWYEGRLKGTAGRVESSFSPTKTSQEVGGTQDNTAASPAAQSTTQNGTENIPSKNVLV